MDLEVLCHSDIHTSRLNPSTNQLTTDLCVILLLDMFVSLQENWQKSSLDIAILTTFMNGNLVWT